VQCKAQRCYERQFRQQKNEDEKFFPHFTRMDQHCLHQWPYTTKLLPTGLHTMCTPPPTFLDLPLQAFLKCSKCPLTDWLTEGRQSKSLYSTPCCTFIYPPGSEIAIQEHPTLRWWANNIVQFTQLCKYLETWFPIHHSRIASCPCPREKWPADAWQNPYELSQQFWFWVDKSCLSITDYCLVINAWKSVATW